MGGMFQFQIVGSLEEEFIARAQILLGELAPKKTATEVDRRHAWQLWMQYARIILGPSMVKATKHGLALQNLGESANSFGHLFF